MAPSSSASWRMRNRLMGGPVEQLGAEWVRSQLGRPALTEVLRVVTETTIGKVHPLRTMATGIVSIKLSSI
jgi:hypothetical protein